MSDTRRPVGVLGALALATVGLAGCPAFDDGDYVYLDELEGPLCAGVPCGWTRVAGPEEGARWGESLPGEHGLHLTGPGVVVRVDPAVALPFAVNDSELALDLIARCDPDDPTNPTDVASDLVIEIGVTDNSTGTQVGLEPMRNILTSWSQDRPNTTALGNAGLPIRSIDTITIAKVGDGRCEIDFIGIALVRFGF